MPDDAVPTQVIDGRPCTTRAGIAALAGWAAGNSVHVRASTDPDFPTPINGQARGRTSWYPLDGPGGVHVYLELLNQRAAQKKPPATVAGDPDDLLIGPAAAEALHISWATLRSYARHSRPHWRGERTGRPLLPPPDHGDADTGTADLGWRRRTLTDHQASRPGPGNPGPAASGRT